MKRLLVFAYFCPGATHCPGGVQQVVPPLLERLTALAGWEITVVHTGECCVAAGHVPFDDCAVGATLDQVDPRRLQIAARHFSVLCDVADVILSIDRAIPFPCSRPRVLMSNTDAYRTEVAALTAPGWSTVIVPSCTFGNRVRNLVSRTTRLEVIPYGLRSDLIERLLLIEPPCWESNVLRVALPHRPDPRKGHLEALHGVAEGRRLGIQAYVDVSWLNEERYEPFRRVIERAAAELGVLDALSITPWLDGNDRLARLSAVHAVLQIGEFPETFGLSAVEAAMAGRLVVTCAQGAIGEAVPPSLVVDIDNPRDWCRDLHDVISTRPKTASVDPAQFVGSLSLDAMARAYDEVLSEQG